MIVDNSYSDHDDESRAQGYEHHHYHHHEARIAVSSQHRWKP